MTEKKATKKKTIYELLHDVQKNIVAPKNQYNKFGKYKYRSCEDVLEGVKSVLPEGCNVTLSDQPVLIGNSIYIKATASFLYAGADISVDGYAREEQDKKGMDAAQMTGSASSYARKYALNGLFCIDDTKDADAQEKHEVKQATASKQQVAQSDNQAVMKRAASSILSKLKKCADKDSCVLTWAEHEDDINDIKSASEKLYSWLHGEYEALLKNYEIF